MKSVTVESASILAGGRVIEFKRLLGSPPKEVWAALTEPNLVSQWYGNIESSPAEGKKSNIHFVHSKTDVKITHTRVTAPSVLEYTWGAETPKSKCSLAGSRTVAAGQC
jgi:uncharacterized protein YndB with AHSA1/START domain